MWCRQRICTVRANDSVVVQETSGFEGSIELASRYRLRVYGPLETDEPLTVSPVCFRLRRNTVGAVRDWERSACEIRSPVPPSG
jgi:hypothetical protein